MTPEPTSEKAAFNPLIRPYLILYVAWFLLISVAGIVALPFWLLGVGQWWSRHYFQKLECELTDRALRYRKGILVTVEKTIPLENIQDVTHVEGPLLRRFHLSMLKFETAGGASERSGEMKLIGIIDALEFRNRILAARDRLRSRQTAPVNADAVGMATLHEDLQQILGVLKQIESRQHPDGTL